MKSRALRSAMSLAISLAVALAPWPAWAQTVRVVVPVSGAAGPAAGASINKPLSSAPSTLLSPALSSLSAPSLQVAGAPVPLERASVSETHVLHAAGAFHASPLAPARLVAPAAFASRAPLRPVAAAIRAANAPIAPSARREFPDRAGAELARTIRVHALDRGFDLGSEASAGAFGSGGRRLPAASADKPERRAAPPAADKPARRGLSLASTLWIILGNVALIQFGVEAMSLAVPQYALGVFGYGAMAAVSAASSIALAAGSLLGSSASDKLGAERTYFGTLAARVAVTGTLAAFYWMGALPAAALVGLFALDFVLHYMNYVALDALAPRWLGNDTVRLNRFGLRRQIAIDATGLLGPLGAGLAIALWGYGSVFWTYPALFVLSTLAGLLALRGRGPGAAKGLPEEEKKVSWRETLRAIARTPALRWSVLGFALITTAMMSLYFLVGPAFGAAAAAAAAAANLAAAAVSGGSAAQITSVMTGLFAGGGILGSLLQGRLTTGIETEAARLPDEARAAYKARAILRRMGWSLALTGLSILSFWAILGTAPIAVFSIFGFSVPLYLAQLLMIPLGVAWAIPTVGLVTILQSQTSAGAKAKTAGVNRFTAMFASFLFSLAMGSLFSSLGGTMGFVAFAAVMTVFAAATIAVGWRLARAGREPKP